MNSHDRSKPRFRLNAQCYITDVCVCLCVFNKLLLLHLCCKVESEFILESERESFIEQVREVIETADERGLEREGSQVNQLKHLKRVVVHSQCYLVECCPNHLPLLSCFHYTDCEQPRTPDTYYIHASPAR